MTQVETQATKNQLLIRKKSSGIAFLILDAPGKVNLLTSALMDEFDRALDELERDSQVKAIGMLSGKAETFCSGADLHEIMKFTDREQALALSSRGQAIFNKAASISKPTVIGINGVCLGGGLELALCADRRIATRAPITLIGLPEVKLGFIPGLGGTQRLPRLIGPRAAMEIIVGAEPITAAKAKEVGLVDEVVDADNLLDAVEQACLELAAKGKPAPPDKVASDLPPEKQKSFFAMAERSVRIKTRGKYPAPMKAIESMKVGLDKGITEGLKFEADAFADLSMSEVSKNLVFLYFTTEFAKQSASATFEKLGASRKLNEIGIVGGGMMGSSLAYLAALSGLKVWLKPVREERTEQLIGTLREQLGRVDGAQPDLVQGTTEYSALANCDVIVEACAEDEETKQTVLNELQKAVKPTCIITTNTSSLAINGLAEHLPHPENFLSTHFFYPVDKMPLVEIASHNATSREAAAVASGLVARLGKTPLAVKDSPSFLVNRLLYIYILQVAKLATQDHVPLNWLEDAAVDFGMPMGPLAMLDEVGFDVAHMVAQSLYKGFGERMKPPAVVQDCLNMGLIGKKSGEGMYKWDASGKRLGINDKLITELGCVLSTEKATQQQLNDLADAMILPMVDEACRCIEEKVVRRPREVDLAVVLGVGFPPFRGGLLRHADSVGLPNVIERLRTIYGTEPQFQISNHLLKLAEAGRGFYTRGAGED